MIKRNLFLLCIALTLISCGDVKEKSEQTFERKSTHQQDMEKYENIDTNRSRDSLVNSQDSVKTKVRFNKK